MRKHRENLQKSLKNANQIIMISFKPNAINDYSHATKKAKEEKSKIFPLFFHKKPFLKTPGQQALIAHT